MVDPVVMTYITATIKRLEKVKFIPDPLLSLQMSRTVSVADSAKKRHGHIIALALATELRKQTAYPVWEFVKYHGTGSPTVIDMIVYYPDEWSLQAYEIKRGNGPNDAGKMRQILREIELTENTLHSFAEGQLRHGKNQEKLKVKYVGAWYLSWYGNSLCPPEHLIVGKDVDEHFQCVLYDKVEEATTEYRSLLRPLLGDVII